MANNFFLAGLVWSGIASYHTNTLSPNFCILKMNHNISNVFSVEINGEYSIFDRLTFNVRMFWQIALKRDVNIIIDTFICAHSIMSVSVCYMLEFIAADIMSKSNFRVIYNGN